MANAKIKLFSLLAVVLLLSATCSGFLVGRTVRLHQEGKLDRMEQVSDQVIDVGTFAYNCIDVIKWVMLR